MGNHYDGCRDNRRIDMNAAKPAWGAPFPDPSALSAQIGQGSSPIRTPLQGIADRITSLSYSDMLRLAAELTHTDHLNTLGSVNETAQRLLNAAANLKAG